MANPQWEDGYTKIATEILEKLYETDLDAIPLRIVLFIIRKTYGWGKKKDKISLSQFEKALKKDRTSICRNLTKLSNMKIIIRIQDDKGNEYSLNKNYEDWQVVAPTPRGSHDKAGSGSHDNGVVAPTPHTIDTIQKIINNREISLSSKITTGDKYVPNFKPPSKFKMGNAYRKKGNEFGSMVVRLGVRFNEKHLERFKEEYMGGSFSVDKIASQVSIWKKNGMVEEDFVGVIDMYFKSKKADELVVTLNACFSDHSIMAWKQGKTGIKKQGTW
jgi:phage replication O-like protein O